MISQGKIRGMLTEHAVLQYYLIATTAAAGPKAVVTYSDDAGEHNEHNSQG